MLLDAFQLGERVLQQVDNLRTLVHAITVVAQIGACGRNLKASHLYEVVDDFKILYIAIRIVAHPVCADCPWLDIRKLFLPKTQRAFAYADYLSHFFDGIIQFLVFITI